MESKINKIKKYYRENGFTGTIKKIYRYTSFKIKVKQVSRINKIYKLTKEDKETLNLKNTKKVYIFAEFPCYSASEDTFFEIAKTFNDMGYIVKYFYSKKTNNNNKILLPLVEHKRLGNIDINKYKNEINSNDICIFEEDSQYAKIANDNHCKIFYKKDFANVKDYYQKCSDIIETEDICPSEFYNNISVIILNYNNKKVIENCINSIIKFNQRYNVEIIVVDNQSTDGSYELLQNKYNGKIKLYRNSKNGCSSGRNLGVSKAEKKYIMFLDSDQWILHKYWIEPYIEILEQDNKIGAIGWAAGWFNKEGYSYQVVDSFPYKYMPPMGLYRCNIGYLGTGGLILKRELFNQIEGFDINYDPTCYEDTDLSLKIRNAGFEIAYTTYLGVGHLPHQTTKSGSKEHSNLIKNKGDYFISKWKKINPKLLNYIK